jgi:hypothetical protein
MSTRRKSPAPQPASGKSLVLYYGTAALGIFGAAVAAALFLGGSPDEKQEPPVVQDAPKTVAAAPFPEPMPAAPAGSPAADDGKSTRFLQMPPPVNWSAVWRERARKTVAPALAKVERPACESLVRNDALRCQYIGDKKGSEARAACERSAQARIQACNEGGGMPPLQTVF